MRHPYKCGKQSPKKMKLSQDHNHTKHSTVSQQQHKSKNEQPAEAKTPQAVSRATTSSIGGLIQPST